MPIDLINKTGMRISTIGLLYREPCELPNAVLNQIHNNITQTCNMSNKRIRLMYYIIENVLLNDTLCVGSPLVPVFSIDKECLSIRQSARTVSTVRVARNDTLLTFSISRLCSCAVVLQCTIFYYTFCSFVLSVLVFTRTSSRKLHNLRSQRPLLVISAP